jgi:hypothetical protein
MLRLSTFPLSLVFYPTYYSFINLLSPVLCAPVILCVILSFSILSLLYPYLLSLLSYTPLPLRSFFNHSLNSVVGVAPGIMGVGPAYAIPVALRNAGLTLKDIDVFEINEVCLTPSSSVC